MPTLLDTHGNVIEALAAPPVLPVDAEPDELEGGLREAEVLAIEFPSFADGRGLSLAALLRTRMGYAGRLRACGDLLADVLPALVRCGFDEFEIADEADLDAAREALRRPRRFYQGSVIDPLPHFRRAG